MNTEQERAEFEAWRRKHYDYDDLDAFEIEFAFDAYKAGRAAPQSQASGQSAVLPSEAVYAFAAWLTCLDEAVTFGSTHDAAPAAELVDQFVKSQAWEQPRDDYPSRLRPYPSSGQAPATNADALAALKAENEMLRELLKDADNEMDQLDEEMDTCDHSVGVCACSYWSVRRKMKAALAKENSND